MTPVRPPTFMPLLLRSAWWRLLLAALLGLALLALRHWALQA